MSKDKNHLAYLFDGTEFFSGHFVGGNRFEVDFPGPLERYGVVAGHVLDTINGCKITPDSLIYWTPRNPAKSVLHTCTNDGKTTMRDLRLSR